MKGKILLIILALAFAVPSFAQKQGSNKDEKAAKRKEMMEFKLKFLGDEIGLTDSQKKQFDEVYSQMDEERRVVNRKIRHAKKEIEAKKETSDADYNKALKDLSQAREDMAQIEKKYDEKLAKVLSAKQLYKLKEAETQWMNKMRMAHDKKKKEKK